jgi:protein SERAC1
MSQFSNSDLPNLYSIVAVHGLNGDAIKSWSSEDICWLNHPDLLPKYVKRARVVAWGYNANISSLTGNTTSSERILQHAQTLVAQLQADRDVSGSTIQLNRYPEHLKTDYLIHEYITKNWQLEDANNRPIIFLCHSLGGIIVKRVSHLAQFPK